MYKDIPDVLHSKVVEVSPLLGRPLLMLCYVLLVSPFLTMKTDITIQTTVGTRREILIGILA